jgi:hypothetical protein
VATPPVGWGCRSLSFVIYAALQVLLMLFFIPGRPEVTAAPWRWFMTAVFAIMALFTGVVTTLMQILGVYRNCFCYVNANMWFNLANAEVDVASDTKEARMSSNGWIVMGGVATAFMGVCSFLGWWFRDNIRVVLEGVVKEIDDD